MINYPALLAVIQEAYDDNWTPECLANYILQELASHEAYVPVSVGDYVFFACDEFPEYGGPYVAAEYVSDISSRGFFYSDDRDDPTRADEFVPFSEIGDCCYLTREEAEAACAELKRRYEQDDLH